MRSLDRRAMLAGLSATMISAGLPGAASSTPSRPLLSRVETDRGLVALTFDDGPHPVHTPRLLNILAHHRHRATFYVIGANARRYPEILHRMIDEGHEIANHTWTHPDLKVMTDTGVLSELDRGQDLIGGVTGFAPTTIRPPYGLISARQGRMIMDNRGLRTVLWSVDPRDWQRPGAARVAERILAQASPGAIILAHDIHAATVTAVPLILNGLAQRGLTSVQVSELIDGRRWGRPGAPRPSISGGSVL
jgi:peptidoglycan/xylan/chitin deacetylase (PgdA/CDA1 family)